MRAFSRYLAERNPQEGPPDSREWVFVPYDQLTDVVGPLSRGHGAAGLLAFGLDEEAAVLPHPGARVAEPDGVRMLRGKRGEGDAHLGADHSALGLLHLVLSSP